MRKKHDHFWGYMTISVVRKATISVAIDSLWNSPPAGSTTRWGWQCTTIAPFLGGAGRFRVLSACGVAGQLTICSLTIDDFSVPRRQTQQSSIGNPAIVNFLGTAGLRADAARWGVWLRLRRDMDYPLPFRAASIFW
jgi:hypothetical protein